VSERVKILLQAPSLYPGLHEICFETALCPAEEDGSQRVAQNNKFILY